MLGCINLDAINYNPAATEDDYSCLYHITKSGEIFKFHDLIPTFGRDTSFTLSFSVEGKSWVFYHDYIPDFYFHTRNELWGLKNQRIYKHRGGVPGIYHDDIPKSFFIDVVFRSDGDLLLETVNWISEVLDSTDDNSGVESEWDTMTHISIWNSQQHTGRIALSTLFNQLQYSTHRRTQGEWSFDDFRNVLADRGIQFLKDLFNDYALMPAAVADKGWYDKELMEDKYFVVRFEHDNMNSKQVILHSTNIQALKSDR